MAGFKAMIFDMDGTLLDSMYDWRILWREYADAHHIDPLPEEMRGKTLYGTGKSCRAFSKLTGASYDEIFDEMMVYLDRHYKTDVEAKPDAAAMLTHLKSLGYIVGVATATRCHMAVPALKRCGLFDKIDFFTNTDQMGIEKSSPEFFRRVAGALGVKPTECVMFEDAVYAMRSAKAAGMGLVAIDEPTAYGDLDEIKALADRYIYGWNELLEGEPLTGPVKSGTLFRTEADPL